MESAQILLSQNLVDTKRLRMIHLLRDPRGHAVSLMGKNIARGTRKYEFIERVCARFKKDVEIQRKLRNLYPKSIMEMHYEDLAHNPVKTAEQIYQFIINSPAPTPVTQWLEESTKNVMLEKETPFGTQRRNSSETAEAWHSKMPDSVVQNVDAKCSEFYQISGYYRSGS